MVARGVAIVKWHHADLMQIEGSGGELLTDRVGGIFLVLANVFDDVGIG
jgi:hypothetical protein